MRIKDNNLEEAAKKFLKLASRLRRLGAGNNPPEEIQVSSSQLALIEYAEVNPGCSMQEMAEALNLSNPTVSIGVRKLEQSNLLMRKADPEDGRVARLFLTPTGQEVYRRSKIFHCQKFEQLLSGLKQKERNTLLNLLERALNAAENK